MNSKTKQSSSTQDPAQNTSGTRPLPLRRPVRKLFEPEAKPLDATAPSFETVQGLRRRPRLWIIAGLLALGLGSAHVLADGETPAPGSGPDSGAHGESGEPEEGHPTTNAVPPVEDFLVETNGFSETNGLAETNDLALPAVRSDTQELTEEHRQMESDVPPTMSAPSDPAPASAAQTQAARTPAGREASKTGESAPEQASRGAGVPKAQAAPPVTPRVIGPEFAAFRIITERNIFNPNRAPRQAQNTSSRPKPVSVDAFSLVGIMSYEKGTFAFFDGTDPNFRKALKEEDSIANFKVEAIEGNVVKLASAEKQLELQVGMQVRREDQGQWRVAESSGNATAYNSNTPASNSQGSSKSTETGGSAAAGDADEVLKRLMQRREQE